ncbi:MAG: hypothetical protein AMJ61_10960 [Desulfobacterales bacterium SG8_35_2]|nr:MAG: hypothetical protein AMJ61_10960 [Desulfobacterales bacterium SG8_35_2]
MEFFEPGKEMRTENILRVDQDDNLVIPAEQVPEFMIFLDCLVMPLERTLQAGGNAEFRDRISMRLRNLMIVMPNLPSDFPTFSLNS